MKKSTYTQPVAQDDGVRQKLTKMDMMFMFGTAVFALLISGLLFAYVVYAQVQDHKYPEHPVNSSTDSSFYEQIDENLNSVAILPLSHQTDMATSFDDDHSISIHSLDNSYPLLGQSQNVRKITHFA